MKTSNLMVKLPFGVALAKNSSPVKGEVGRGMGEAGGRGWSVLSALPIPTPALPLSQGIPSLRDIMGRERFNRALVAALQARWLRAGQEP